MKKFGTWLMVLIVAALIVYTLGGFSETTDIKEDTPDVVVEADTGDIVAIEDDVEEVEEIIEEEGEDTDDADMTTPTVDLEKSLVLWEGRANGKSHNGDVQIKEATLEMEDGTLVGGTFVIDMDTLKSIEDDGSTIDKLNEHLKADDFFDVANYATAELTITGVEEDTIDAELTIKGQTHPVVLTRTDSDNGLSASFSIDSTKWGVQDGGSLVDQAKNALVADDIDFVVTLILK